MAHGDTALLAERSDPAHGEARSGRAQSEARPGHAHTEAHSGVAFSDHLPGTGGRHALDDDDPAEAAPDADLPDGLVGGLTSFATAHQGARAIIEYVGRRGARIVLVGGDETWGDQFAPSTDVARQACAAAGVPVENSWERELIEQMGPARNLWRSMSRRTLAR